MFTGLIQTTGSLHYRSNYLVEIRCDHSPEKILSGLDLGDSVAVDGICLTVTEILSQGFLADVSPETLTRTTLGRSGEIIVNLEPSLRVGSKLGGHFVTGHIDGIGYLESVVQSAIAWTMRFRVADAKVARYIVPKGSIAINGISLTIADCDPIGSWFSVAVIPVTYAETNLRSLQVGSSVNLEGDVLGKYVEKFLRMDQDTHQEALHLFEQTVQVSGLDPQRNEITPSFLAEHGYM